MGYFVGVEILVVCGCALLQVLSFRRYLISKHIT